MASEAARPASEVVRIASASAARMSLALLRSVKVRVGWDPGEARFTAELAGRPNGVVLFRDDYRDAVVDGLEMAHGWASDLLGREARPAVRLEVSPAALEARERLATGGARA